MLSVIIILIIIFYITNYYILKKQIKENYLTYFLPYYDQNINPLSNFYKDNDNNKNYFKKKFSYKPINFGFVKDDAKIVKLLISFYISNSTTQKVNLIKYSNSLNNIKDLVDNKIDLCVTDFPTLICYTEILNNNIDKLKLVTQLFNIYIYPFTKKSYNIFSLDDITPDTIIGIIKDSDPFYYYYDRYFDFLGYKNKTDYKIKLYDNSSDLFNGFINNECQMIFITGVFPNDNIKTFLDNNINSDILLLPFNISKEELFLKKNHFIHISYIDLNDLSASYLPVKFNENEYTINRPSLKICAFYKILLSNVNTDTKYIYSFINFLHTNLKYINNNLENKLLETQVYDQLIYITYHEGSLRFFRDYGFISNIDNDNCKYLVGVKECNQTNLQDNNLL